VRPVQLPARKKNMLTSDGRYKPIAIETWAFSARAHQLMTLLGKRIA